ncbi:MAG: orotidine-5'-phosphate decarboxylase [Acidobacteriaceae bacterium]|nr:orotidine-5'-phosphate decarboxylase [Acidobacteriaceae bacterium]MBV8573257.1 orotidine-5'-phosphate decarboxylase [Acidobacteriaceae bacterium]
MNPLIIALDVESAGAALNLMDRIGDAADFYKVGMELYAAEGMAVVDEISGRGKSVFLDLKLYDIGETVKRATRQISSSGKVKFLTVHGSRSVMDAAREGRGDSNTRLLAVTVLTSFDQEDLADLGYPVPVTDLVELRVRKARESGMNGIVCSPLEVARVRAIGGTGLTLVTPGVRSAGSAKGDQKRVATPAEALRDGADYLVIGRQVTRAADPRLACEEILAEVKLGAGAKPALQAG